MLISKTPLRISLGGGGSDLPPYYTEHGGFIFSITINKYIYVGVGTPFDNLVRVKYSEQESVRHSRFVKHKTVRESLLSMDIQNKIDIVSLADIPAGTGLGSSGAFTVGLLNALHSYVTKPVSKKELAEEACNIEMNILRLPDGKQDPYLASFGGFTILDIDKDGKVDVRSAKVSQSTIHTLNSNLLMFYTGVTHQSGRILREQGAKIKRIDIDVIESMHYIKELGYEMLETVESGNVHKVGLLFDKHWEYKKAISNKMTNRRFNSWYEAAKRNGAIGGKIIGSGGGGMFLFYVEQNHKRFIDEMEKLGLQFINYSFDFIGSRILDV
jgi:D-glycero-alpha-D-manno-heptose-7-phosphate kinase